jgi:hypothetical protein
MVILGVAALALYSLSWVFRWMQWPGVDVLRIAALIPFAVGVGIWVYDWRRKSRAQAQYRKKSTGWEDILDEEDDANASGER